MIFRHACTFPKCWSRFQDLARERLEGYRLHVENAREEIEALQVIFISASILDRIPLFSEQAIARSIDDNVA